MNGDEQNNFLQKRFNFNNVVHKKSDKRLSFGVPKDNIPPKEQNE